MRKKILTQRRPIGFEVADQRCKGIYNYCFQVNQAPPVAKNTDTQIMISDLITSKSYKVSVTYNGEEIKCKFDFFPSLQKGIVIGYLHEENDQGEIKNWCIINANNPTKFSDFNIKISEITKLKFKKMEFVKDE